MSSSSSGNADGNLINEGVESRGSVPGQPRLCFSLSSHRNGPGNPRNSKTEGTVKSGDGPSRTLRGRPPLERCDSAVVGSGTCQGHDEGGRVVQVERLVEDLFVGRVVGQPSYLDGVSDCVASEMMDGSRKAATRFDEPFRSI